MGPEVLAWIVLGLYALVNGIGVAEGINPLEDRPPGYVVAGLVFEVALLVLLAVILI